MCVYVYICIYIHTYIHTHVCVYIYQWPNYASSELLEQTKSVKGTMGTD